ncbi:MAG: hypothetical protein SF051_03215 [Elusimicrobiota bacterium]|nr:hypothetical protein [Elusimicrobiota bacterium]
MGPGLFLALALAFLAGPAAAETTVGLDARGVNPMAAVDNRWGLDIRDELGRPVSGEKVLGELKQASAARAAANAFASKLAHAAALLSALEVLQRAASNLRGLAAGLPRVLAAVAMPGPRPKVAALLLAVVALLSVSAVVVHARPAAAPLKAGRCCPEVLRC